MAKTRYQPGLTIGNETALGYEQVNGHSIEAPWLHPGFICNKLKQCLSVCTGEIIVGVWLRKCLKTISSSYPNLSLKQNLQIFVLAHTWRDPSTDHLRITDLPIVPTKAVFDVRMGRLQHISCGANRTHKLKEPGFLHCGISSILHKSSHTDLKFRLE
jgi:hypothetical protein